MNKVSYMWLALILVNKGAVITQSKEITINNIPITMEDITGRYDINFLLD